jgi:hypothetical protein
MAIRHAAVYDAVNAIDRTHADYLVHVDAPPGASEPAAAAAAAHDVLTQLYPGQQATLDSDLAASLATIPDSHPRATASRSATKQRRRSWRCGHDGSAAAPIPFVAGTNPGDYQPTPPAFAQPVFTHWRFVTPFTLRNAQPVPTRAAPAADQRHYTADFNQVKSLGNVNSTSRTPTKRRSPSSGSTDPELLERNRPDEQRSNTAPHCAERPSARPTRPQPGRLVIAFYDAKYTYHHGRPITATRVADTDRNPPQPDPNWTPLATTALDPPTGAHATITPTQRSSSPASTDRTATPSPSPPRSAPVGDTIVSTSFSGRSPRSQQQPHTTPANTSATTKPQGQRLGLQIGNWVLTHFSPPGHGRPDETPSAGL